MPPNIKALKHLTLNESRAWTRSDSGSDDVSAAERDAYGRACTLPDIADRIAPDGHGYCPTAPRPTLHVVPSVDVSGFRDAAQAAIEALTAEIEADNNAAMDQIDRTAKRGGNPLVAAAFLAIPALVAALWFLLGAS